MGHLAGRDGGVVVVVVVAWCWSPVVDVVLVVDAGSMLG